MFCTDDKYPDELDEGYIDEMTARCIAKGMPLWNVLTAATLAPAQHYGMNVGLLGKGDKADFIVVRDLKGFDVMATYIDGYCVYDGEKDDVVVDENEEKIINNFKAEELRDEDIAAVSDHREVKVIEAQEGQLYTHAGKGIPGVERDILKIVVYNRYKKARPAIGYIKGFGLKRGALASTIAHDSHNIIAVGCSDRDIVKAVNRLVETKGGFCVADGDRVEDIALPIAGLMSPLRGEELGRRHNELKAMAGEIGCKFKAPYMTLAFMALPVIPELKLIDTGLFDGRKFGFTDVMASDIN